MGNYKTVSWYIHSFQLRFPLVTLHTSDRQVISCTAGYALLHYGHYYVDYAVLSESYAEFVLVTTT